MKVNKIIIKNYKSIKYLELEINNAGKPLSYTKFFIGQNGSGKSNILNAINLPMEEFDDTMNFNKLKNKHTEEKTLSVIFDLNLDNDVEYREYIKKYLYIPEELCKKITIKEYIRTTLLNKGEKVLKTNAKYTLKQNLPVNKYRIAKVSELKKTKNYNQKYTLPPTIKYVILENSKIPADDREYYEILTLDILTTVTNDGVHDYNYDMVLPIDFWKPKQEYLLVERLNLKTFAEKIDNIPLENLFHKCGYNDKEQIQSIIKDAENEITEKQKLENNLNQNLNDFLQYTAREYNICVDMRINDNLDIDFFIKDNNDKINVFKMDERSDGFKYYISFLLSLSIGSDAGSIKDRIILIDEPELHLHPSSIRALKTELVNLGINNYVFISTHSNYLLDNEKSSRSRHYIVKKDKDCNTEIRNINSDEDLFSEEILLNAFGFDIFNDILPRKILLVEGESDLGLIQKALKDIDKKNSIKIISCYGASKMINPARYFTNEHCKVIALLDNDPSGKGSLKNLTEKIKGDDNNKYFLISDLITKRKNIETIEDLLSFDYIQYCLYESCKVLKDKKFKLNAKSPVMYQITAWINKYNNTNNKEININSVINKFKTSITENKAKINEKNAKSLYELAAKINRNFSK